MYIRTTQRKNKDGSVIRYVQLAHNFRDEKTGHAKAKVLYSFGREDQVDKDSLRRLVASIEKFLGPEEALRRMESAELKMKFEESRPLGGVWALEQLWSELGIGKVINRHLEDRGFQIPVERAIFAMVANRALAPMSKLAVEEWVAKDVPVTDLENLQVHHLYRSLDALIEMEEELQKEVFFAVSDLLNLEVDLLFFDTTSTYFEIENEDVDDDEEGDYLLRRRGHSKDSRPDLAQVVIGLAVTKEGIPVRVWTWPGNTADVTRISEVKKDLIGWKLGRVITVVDRGFMSESNLKELQRTGGHYIVGEKMRSGKPEVEEALARAGRFQPVRHNVEVKEVIVGDGEARKRYVVVRNPQQRERDEKIREAMVKTLEAEIAGLKQLDNGGHGKAVCRLMSHKTYGRYLKLKKDGLPRIDRAKLKAESRTDGKYLLLTSDDTLSAEDVALGYKQLLEVEDAFRTLKQTLELRPVYHRLSRRIRSHVNICWLALLLIRVAEVRTEQALGELVTWDKMRTELDRMHLGRFSLDGGILRQRTEMTNQQARLFKAIGVEEPPPFFQITA